ncbi:MAG: ABC transporter ATP-binding protein [Fidelibacterota bacterium]
MIELKRISKSFDSLVAVDSVSLKVEPGEIFSFLGPNGAGKTTTIKMMVGLMTPDSGSIRINGANIVEEPIKTKMMIGYVPDAPFLYDKLTGGEFLSIIGSLYQMDHKKMRKGLRLIINQLDMNEWISDRVEGYSQGMRQRLAFAAAFLHDPKVIILDEPTVGLDPKTARKIKDMLKEKAQEGITIFLSTHNLNVAEELSDRIAIINRGTILGIGTVESFQTSKQHEGSLEDLFLDIVEEEETNVTENKPIP